MKARLQYGRDGIEVEVPSDNVTVVTPRYVPGLEDEAARSVAAVRQPLGAQPLRELVRPAIGWRWSSPTSPGRCRPTACCPGSSPSWRTCPPERFTIVNGTGSHRANTPEELAAMVGPDVLERYRVVNHDAHDPATSLPRGAGRTAARCT